MTTHLEKTRAQTSTQGRLDPCLRGSFTPLLSFILSFIHSPLPPFTSPSLLTCSHARSATNLLISSLSLGRSQLPHSPIAHSHTHSHSPIYLLTHLLVTCTPALIGSLGPLFTVLPFCTPSLSSMGWLLQY